MKVAVIGTGRIAAEHLAFLSSQPRITLDSVCDLSPTVASFTADKYGAVTAATSIEAALDRHPDVVHICTPARSHEAIIRLALEANAHVICEKPVALSVATYDELAALAQSRGLVLTEDHNYRFNSPFTQLQSTVQSGQLGNVRDVAVTMVLPLKGGRYLDDRLPSPSHSLPAGLLHEFISHLCYLGLALVPPHRAVSSRWQQLNESPSPNDLSAWIDCGEATLRLRFVDGWPGRIAVTVLGTEGQSECELLRPHVQSDVMRRSGSLFSPPESLLRGGLGSARSAVGTVRDKFLNRTAYSGLATFLGETYAAIQDKTPVPVTDADIRGTLRLINDLVVGKANK